MFEKLKELNILDRYILKQVVETFIISLVIFTSIIFATDAFITIVKQITRYGIPLQIAAMLIMLKLPSMLIMTIPMGVLLSTILTVNRMNNALEITILKACGVGVSRMAKTILICSVVAALSGFAINEVIAPIASRQAKTLTIWAIMQKNVPNGKRNFVFREMKKGQLTRFFHVASVEHNKLKNVTVLDLSRKGTIQVNYSRSGDTTPEGWVLNNGVVYTISTTGKILNTAVYDTMHFDNTAEAAAKIAEVEETEMNYFQLRKYIKNEKKNFEQNVKEKYDAQKDDEDKDTEEEVRKSIKNDLLEFEILLNEKLAMPFTSIVFALIAIPLAITGPRARFNRGLIFSIAVLFMFYILRAFASALGQNGVIPPSLAAWMPNIILFFIGYLLYYKKAYCI
ncbi:MAG: LptF/LptG family permease [bacterium]|nr:LptF/LptG family permease [bacterium]